jgi:methionine biosynthesis protein MetW
MLKINAASPDTHAQGFVAADIDALRYEPHSEDSREVAGILRSMMPARVRVLDVGCGTGSLTAIANRGKDNVVYGIEPDAARAAAARSRGIEVFEGYFTDDYLADGQKFDVIAFADVLEHVAEPAALLRTARKALTSGGIVLVSVPNVAHWTVRARLLLGRFEYKHTGIMDATHLRWFTAKTISELLNRVGFDVLQCEQTAGVGLLEYQNRFFNWMPHRLRSSIIRELARAIPLLFGCQHVLKARINEE